VKYIIFFNDERNKYFGVCHTVASVWENLGYPKIKEVKSLSECEKEIHNLN
jgi:hypothetical protein